MIIGLNGYAGCGKTTAANYLTENHGFIKMSFAKPLKEITSILFDLNEDQLYGDKKDVIDKRYNITPRLLYQVIGTELFRNEFPKHIKLKERIWVGCMRRKLEKNKSKNIVIDDVRFKDEADLIKELGGYIINIERKGQKNNSSHISENTIIDSDITMLNSNIDPFYNQLKCWIRSFDS